METIEGARNVVKIDEGSVTKIGVGFEPARPFRLGIEVHALKTALESGLSVPKVYEYGRNDLGQEYIVMERIRGNNVSEVDLKTPLDVIYNLVGKEMAKMPSDLTSFGWLDPKTLKGESSSWSDFISQHITKYATRLGNNGELDKDMVAKIIQLVEKNTPNIQAASMIHRDLKPLNLMVNNEKVTILDWENVLLGDPLYDLGVLVSRFPDDERLIKGFMIGLIDNVLDKDQNRTVSVYSLVNLVGGLCFYRGKAPRAYYNRVAETVRALESKKVKSTLSSRTIKTPNPLPSYTSRD